MKRTRKLVNELLIRNPGMEAKSLLNEANRRTRWGITSRELAQLLRSAKRRG